jgi:hypothetical protein
MTISTGRRTLDYLFHAIADFFDARFAIHGYEHAVLPVIIGNRLGLAVVSHQARFHNFRRVIRAPPDQLLRIHPYIDHDGLAESQLGQNPIELLGLRQRPGKPVKNKTFRGIRLRQAK